MAGRTVSLPDLVTEKRRNTTLSLTEGFAGARHEMALTATSFSWCPKPGVAQAYAGSEAVGNGLVKVLPVYYRTRQTILQMEKSEHSRVPQQLISELRTLEKAVGAEIRQINPLLFSRFDEFQMDRLLRAMPFLRLSVGRWIYGAESLGAAWPANQPARSFILLSGKVALYPDPTGGGPRTDILRGAIFGEQKFLLVQEPMQDFVSGSAHCEEPCIVGILDNNTIEAAFADRAFGNRRIAQLFRSVSSISKLFSKDAEPTLLPERKPSKQTSKENILELAKAELRKALDEEKEQVLVKPYRSEVTEDFTTAIQMLMADMAKVSSCLHVPPGTEVLSDEPLTESVLVVSKGTLEVNCDLTLVEKLESLPPRKVRLRICIEKAENLSVVSVFDKLDPYVICKIHDFKRFQTQVYWNAGENAVMDYKGVLAYANETNLEVTVMASDKFGADNLIGTGSVPIETLPENKSFRIPLSRPRKGPMKEEDSLEESTGFLHCRISWDYAKVSSLSRPPKERTWRNQTVFTVKVAECWGHEQIILGSGFKRILEQAASSMKYALYLENFRVVARAIKGGREPAAIWKINRKSFTDYVKGGAKTLQFQQACRVSALEKQTALSEVLRRLVEKWNAEEEAQTVRARTPGMVVQDITAVDPQKFRVSFRGQKALVTVRNALNLGGSGFFSKLDPYVVLRFRGSKSDFRTSVLQDTGGDPVWNCEGYLQYSGEVALEIAVWDYEPQVTDVLIATGIIQVEQFCNGFEGVTPLTILDKKRRGRKQPLIVIGVQWEVPDKPSPRTLTGTFNNLALTGGMQRTLNSTG